MHEDETPTLPHLRWDDDEARSPGGMPTWPRGRASTPRSSAPWDRQQMVLGMSLAANGVLLASLLLLLFLARAGAFSPSSSSAQSAPPAPAPTATPTSPHLTPSASLTPLSGWLQVAPTSVQLGCDGGQQTQFAVLTNTGPEDLQWRAAFAVPTDQAGMEVSPQQGDLRAGTSVTLQIHNRSQSAGQQGVMSFDPGTPAAGTPPTLSYTTVGCDG
jgi:hypothetical protein